MTPPRTIDLHTHSTASDGTTPPAALVAEAHASGLDVVALTDHDTVAGWEAAAALPAGLTLVRGAELSCTTGGDDPVSLHLLAYLFDPDEPALARERDRVRSSRTDRGRRMVERLAAAGHPVTWEQVQRIAGDGAVGRPHVARALVEHGLVGSVDAAFSPQWLAKDGPYYVDKEETEVLTAVRMVRAAGGVPVFAHPAASSRGRTVSDDVVAAMAHAGLAGLEVDHTDHTDEQREHLRGLAADLGLLVTGSSDYHGTNKSVRLGARTTTPEAYERLLAEARGCPPLVG